MWGTLLARALAPFGILVIIPDDRKFPRVIIDGMVHDVDMCIQSVFVHCDAYGGDKDKVVLVGQSAGAHIGGVVVATSEFQPQLQCSEASGRQPGYLAA